MTFAIELLADPADAELAGWPEASGDGPLVALGDARSDGTRRSCAGSTVRHGRTTASRSSSSRPPARACGGEPRGPRPTRCSSCRRPLTAMPRLPPPRRCWWAPSAAYATPWPSEPRSAGVALRQAERLDAASLAGAGCIVMAEGSGGALPARAFAVLAAGRLLITPRLETTFGLEDGLDHLEFAAPERRWTP